MPPSENPFDWIALLPVLGVLVAVALALSLVHWLVYRRKRILRSEPHFQGQLLLIAMTLSGVVLFILVLPVDIDTRGQLLNLLGLLLTAVLALSSTTVVANALAGLMVRSMRSFRTGDFVRCGEAFGRVTQRGLFFTEIQTEQRDLMTLPNQYLISNPMTVVRASGTVVSAELSLGYDLDHERIEELLEQAATEAGLTESFVLVRELGDYSITYRVAGFLEEVSKLVSARSRLRSKVLDVLHGAGVEIMSPSFMNQRPIPNDRAVAPPPRKSKAAADDPEPDPESIVFDKAEEAQLAEELVEKHEHLLKEIKELEQAKADDELVTARRAEAERIAVTIEELRAKAKE